MFLDELGKGSPTGTGADSLENAAHTLTYLIASADPELSSMYMFPWCGFHNPEMQISYTQFLLIGTGDYAATPNGISLMMLHKMTGDRLCTTVSECNAPDAQYRAQAVSDGGSLWVICTNPGKDADTFDILLKNINAGIYEVRTYMCDSALNNCVTGAGNGELAVTCVSHTESTGTLSVSAAAEPNGFALFEFVPDAVAMMYKAEDI